MLVHAGMLRRIRLGFTARLLLVLALLASWSLGSQPVPQARASGVAFAVGDVVAGVGSGYIHHFSPTGTLLDTLNTGTGCSEDLGMAFTASNHLLATASFGDCSGQVVQFDSSGNLIGPFGSGYSSSTESITIDGAGNVYVGQPDGTKQVLKFSSSGAPLGAFSPAPEDRGTDWINLAADQCTLFYTSEGPHVKRFNVCTNTQLTDFATVPSGESFANKLRPNGDLLVAGGSAVYRFDAGGTLLHTYPLPAGQTFLFALNLDPNGTSFWTADYFTGNIYKINILTGAIETSFSGQKVGCCLSGLAVVGEPGAVGGGGNCNVYAKLRGPFFNGHTYAAEPSIDANVNQGMGLVNHHLLYNAPTTGPGPTQQGGSVNSFNATVVSCGSPPDEARSTQDGSNSVTIHGTASGASGAFAVGDQITTTLSMSSQTVVMAVTSISNSTGLVLKGTSTAFYNVGPNGQLIIQPVL